MNGLLSDPTASFFANVQALEGAAAGHYAEAAHKALAAGNSELEAFFASMAELTQLDAQEARSRAGLGPSASLALGKLQAYTDQPQTAIQVGGPAMLALHRATLQALELKRRSHAYYASVALLATEAQLQNMAQAFQSEAAAHLAALENWIVRLTA